MNSNFAKVTAALKKFDYKFPEMRQLGQESGLFAFLLLLTVFVFGCGGGPSGLVVVLNPSGNQAVDQNQSISFTAFVPNDTSNAGVTWTLTGGHCKGAACGTFTSSTPSSVTYQAPKSEPNLLTVTLTATSNAEKSVFAQLNIAVSPAPTISTTTLPGVLNGANYSQQVIANGGVAPLVFSIASGSLPPGLNLNTNGFITGRTTADGGTFNFTLMVTDQGSPQLTATQAYTLSVSAAPALSVATSSLANAAQGTPYNAALAASGGVPPLTWIISSGSLPPGLTLTPATGQISGTPTAQGTFPFTVQVTDSSLLPPNNHSQTAQQSLSITVGAPGALSIVTTSLPQAETANLYSQTILTTGGIGPFNWTLTNGILPSGMSLNVSTGTISGIATGVATNTFTVQVTDSESPPASASATFTIPVIAATNNNGLLKGDYVFVFGGFNPNGPVAFGGMFTADGTGFIQGNEDSNNNDAANTTQDNGPGPTQGNAIAGTYTMNPNGQGTLAFTVNAIVYRYLVALDGDGNGQFIEADTGTTMTRGTGILRKLPTVTPNFINANFSGNYAFELAGIDSNGKRDTLAGVIQADGAGLLKNGNADTNDAGTIGTNISGVTGAFLVAQNGRGNASISIPGLSTLNFITYMITPSDVLFMGFDPLDASHPMTTGEAILQTQPTFDATSMNGVSIATATGQDAAKSSVLLAQLTGDGAGNISAAVHGNDGGSITATSANGTYSVASNGRVSISGLGNQMAAIYLISPRFGFLIGQDSAASSGLAEAQTPGPFTAGSFDSYFSFGIPSTGSPWAGGSGTNDFVGSLVSDGVSSISGKVNETTGSDALNLVLSASATYTVTSTGSGSISFGSPAQLPSQFVFYLVSPTQIRAISSVPSDTQPMVFFLNH